MERKFRAKAQMSQTIKWLLEEDYTDLNYHIDKIANEHKIHPGDMDEFVDALRWMFHCFHTLAELDQIHQVLELTQPALLRLIPPKPAQQQPPQEAT